MAALGATLRRFGLPCRITEERRALRVQVPLVGGVCGCGEAEDVPVVVLVGQVEWALWDGEAAEVV